MTLAHTGCSKRMHLCLVGFHLTTWKPTLNFHASSAWTSKVGRVGKLGKAGANSVKELERLHSRKRPSITWRTRLTHFLPLASTEPRVIQRVRMLPSLAQLVRKCRCLSCSTANTAVLQRAEYPPRLVRARSRRTDARPRLKPISSEITCMHPACPSEPAHSSKQLHHRSEPMWRRGVFCEPGRRHAEQKPAPWLSKTRCRASPHVYFLTFQP